MIAVHSRYCEADDCVTVAVYGLLGKIKTRCGAHRQKGMIRSPTRKCVAPCCGQLGTHELHGERYCEEHRLVDAVNLGTAPCSSCGLDDILTNGKCTSCDPNAARVYQHAKENRIRDLLTVAKISFIHDRMLESTSCGRERPDFQIDCGSHFVYVEVDEHQHSTYACECEQTRMVNLVHVRGMPVTFIRYNPDVYEPAKGQRRMNRPQREKKLIEWVQYAIEHPPQAVANVMYLFYDDHDNTNTEFQTLI